SRRQPHTLRQPRLAQSLLAMASAGMPLLSAAQTAPAQPQTLPAIQVTADAVGYKAETSNPKLTAPLVDTPQTITVITREVLQEQGAISLLEALRNTPGITLQLGENGNTSAGDTFQMRGFATQSSIFIDGMRDLGAVSRDVFNVEQIEVSKGPSGADVGRGAASGYINLATKLPSLEDAISAGVAIDSGDTKRVNVDVNRRLGASSAFRLNVMGKDGGQIGRKAIQQQAHGIAPALAFGLGTPTRVYLYSQHVRQDGRPDGGFPTIGLEGYLNANTLLQNAPMVERNNYYGLAGDFEKTRSDMVTVKIEHQLSPETTLTNTSRYGKSSIDRILTGINTITAAGSAPATWTISRSRQSVLQENTILGNTTNLASQFAAGGFKHALSAGLELLSEEQDAPTRGGLGATNPATASLYNPNPNDALVGYNPALTGASSNGKTNTVAAYAFDTVKVNEQWQLNVGLRGERYNTVSSALTANSSSTNGIPLGTLIGSRLEKSANLVSWKAGAVYKPAANGSIYLSYATSQMPPGSANFALSATASSTSNPNMDPQKTTNIELGTKWDLVEKKLAVTAAAYRSENRNELTAQDAVLLTYSQLGKRRVQGLELGLVGQITPAWNITAGLAKMSAKIVEGSASTVAGTDTRWSPDLTATLWTSYKWNDALSMAGGLRYSSEQKRNVAPGAALTTAPGIPAYAVADAMLRYKVSNNVALQLNVYNLTDKFYVSSLNNGGSRVVLGAERFALLSANILF
ncbi:MAG: catecholate siderophore receptor Fiu, partial [Massilia sp.]